MNLSYLGGIWKRGPVERRRRCLPPSPEAVHEDWGWINEGTELFLRGAASCCRVFVWDALVLLLRGYARPAGTDGPLDLERVAEELRCHYLEHGTLAVEDLEGSFTLAILDGQADRVLLYRNLVGTGFTYYHASPRGLLFGGNLAELVDASGTTPQPNRDVLPSFFLFRCVPGRETLFADYYRLLPGEQVIWDRRGLTRLQRQTFAQLRAEPVRSNPVECLDETMTAVLADCAAARPGAVNLLSGGIDSSYIQAIWNREVQREQLPPSYSVSVDHPMTWADTDYAITASRAIGSRHTLVGADGPYADYLIDALASTGEPPNHVQSAYFGHLARTMMDQGSCAGLCGEGADSLFGLGLANQVHNARLLRGLLPGPMLRRWACSLGDFLGWDRLAATCRLADRLNEFTDLDHPVNQVAVFSDLPAVEACFGTRGVAEGAAQRRELLDRYGVPATALDRLHAVGFLGEAMDSAALWTTMFNRAGADLLCPFLDSRMLRFALNLPAQVRFRFRRPKDLLKQALARHAPAEIVTRCKLGFGQPIFEWLALRGQLRPLVESMAPHEFLDGPTLIRVTKQPTWFLYSLLCYDLWWKLFIDRSLARPTGATPGRRAGSVLTLS
jgi:asparagine synthase (glutamine-hydrolysing)